MLDLMASRQAIIREWEKFTERLRPIPSADWQSSVRCEGWCIANLAAHVAWGISMEADALNRMMLNSTEPATGVTAEPTETPEKLIDAITTAFDGLASKLKLLTADYMAKSVPMPYGPTPAQFALQVFTMEAGIHGSDLADALRIEEELEGDIITATAAVIAGAFPMLAQGSTETPMIGSKYRLSGKDITLDFSFEAGGWQVGPTSGQPTCEISGTDSNIILFALGRIPADDPRLGLTRDSEMGRKFKLYFPGP
jgi:uncharacterized protein (TIGR03083 family)